MSKRNKKKEKPFRPYEGQIPQLQVQTNSQQVEPIQPIISMVSSSVSQNESNINEVQQVKIPYNQTIQCYEKLLEMKEGYFLMEIKGIFKFEQHIPQFNDDSQLNTFLLFIQRMISLENVSKVFGFLEEEKLQTSIIIRFLKYKQNQLDKQQQQDIEEQKRDKCFFDTFRDIQNYCILHKRVPSISKLTMKESYGEDEEEIEEQKEIEESKVDQEIDQENVIEEDLTKNNEIDKFSKEEIKTHFSEVKQKLFNKKIESYIEIQNLPSDLMCRKLYEIVSYEHSIPYLYNNSSLIDFLEFIETLINTVKSKQSTDLQSTQMQIAILNKTIFGFLEQQSLQIEIMKRVNQCSGKGMKNKEYVLDYYQEPIFINLIKQIIKYCNQQNRISKYCKKVEQKLDDQPHESDGDNDSDDEVDDDQGQNQDNQHYYINEDNQDEEVKDQKEINIEELHNMKVILQDEEILVADKQNCQFEVTKMTNIIPSDRDCNAVQNYRGNLQRINLKTPYKNEKQYLENMFNFLRADSHQEIVLSMNEAIKIGKKFDTSCLTDFQLKQKNLKTFRPLRNTFHFYNNIQIISMQYQQSLTLFLSVQPILPKKNFKIQWEQTKRLLGDQYVYLTNYNFERIIRCQIQSFQDSQQIKKLNTDYNVLRIKLKVLKDKYDQSELVKDIYKMMDFNNAIILEPKQYQGQYFSCMNAIKEMVELKFNLPFKNNLVDLQKDILMPAFIKEDTQYELDFTPLQNNIIEKEEKEEKGYLQNILSDWNQVPTINYLTKSQQKAVKNILTKQISLVQGPPGTGKTYVGAMAIRNLLKNSHVWNPYYRPILMVCKTNHALDQFLSHIMKFEKNVLRIGSRSKDEEIRKFQLSEIRKNFKICNSSHYKMIKLEEQLNQSLTYLSSKLFSKNGVDDLIKVLPSDIVFECCKLYLQSFQKYIPFIGYYLNEIMQNKEMKQKVILYWWQLNPAIQEVANNLFYPLIEKYVKQPFKKESKQNIYFGLAEYYSLIEDDKMEYYKGLFDQRNKEFNYFFEADQDDLDDQNMLNQEEINKQNLWMNIQLRKQKIVNYEQAEDEEYAEDRDNFVIYDNEDEDEEENTTKKKFKKRNPKKGTKQFNEEDFLYFTYFQFIHLNIDSLYLNIELKLRDSFANNIQLTFQQQFIIRLWAVKKFSQKKNIVMFSNEEMDEYFQTFNRLQEEKMYSEIKIMSRSKIIAMTMGGACKYSEYLKYLKYEVLIIEEAGEVLENLTIPLLQPFLKQLILIGDHQQLKPSINTYLLEKKYNMNVSLFQRLIHNNLDYECLSEQMRMCPELSDYVRLIYCKPNQYLDSQNVLEYKRNVRGLPSNIMFFMHNYDEQQLSYTTTKKNEKEADLAIGFARYLIVQKEYQASQITILTMYLGQASMIKRKCNNQEILHPIRVSTVDNYQGEENEIIILSLVRSSHQDMGYVKISNRINVSISRAKKGFIVLGNQDLLKSQESLWRSIFQKATINKHIFQNKFTHICSQHRTVLTYSTKSSLYQTKNGGCNRPCKQNNLTCGHNCNNFCHDGHCDEFECQEQINKTFSKCGHVNKIKCYLRNKDESELKCPTKIDVQNDYCDHIQQIECYKYDKLMEEFTDPKFEQELQKQKCNQKCNRSLPCGHQCQEICHELTNSICNRMKCDFKIVKELNCKHKFQGQCGASVTYECKIRVKEKKLPCGHIVNNVTCGIVQKCQKKCEHILSCGHKCIKQFCFEKHECNKQSKRDLDCGHFYLGDCSKDLSDYKCEEISMTLLKCGHGYNTNECFERDLFQCQKEVEYNNKTIKCYQVK